MGSNYGSDMYEDQNDDDDGDYGNELSVYGRLSDKMVPDKDSHSNEQAMQGSTAAHGSQPQQQ